MTHRRIIAGVILLAAVVVAIPFGPGVWRAVAYREVKLDDGFLIYPSRWVWLTGSPGYVPDQACSACLDKSHDCCWRTAESELFDRLGNTADRNVEFYFGTRVDPPMTFRCTCTDSSHAEGSE